MRLLQMNEVPIIHVIRTLLAKFIAANCPGFAGTVPVILAFPGSFPGSIDGLTTMVTYLPQGSCIS